MSNFTKDEIDFLLTPKAIRQSTAKVYDAALNGQTNFDVHEDKLDACAEYVLDVIYENYPSLEIPFHSRWGHFRVGGINRLESLEQKISHLDALEQARIKIDLVITSVLLDAGAGPKWKYLEGDRSFNRSEGLAVASFHMFMDAVFSSTDSLVADAQGLQNFSVKDLENGFQVNVSNPLVGVEGRASLMNKLGECVMDNPFFPGQRPGGMVDYLIEKHGNEFEVQDILDVVLRGLGQIWPGRLESHGVNLGDIWHYSELGDLSAQSVICFHKLSQWLTYSLVTPMIDAGLQITGAEKLTGLAEYRNGGLFLDFGVIELKDEALLEKAHKPDSHLIIEWRALTVQLLDRVGELIQKKLDKTPAEFPLAKVLEGGTWWAGRKIAASKRADNSPPIKLDSDGTVF